MDGLVLGCLLERGKYKERPQTSHKHDLNGIDFLSDLSKVTEVGFPCLLVCPATRPPPPPGHHGS